MIDRMRPNITSGIWFWWLAFLQVARQSFLRWSLEQHESPNRKSIGSWGPEGFLNLKFCNWRSRSKSNWKETMLFFNNLCFSNIGRSCPLIPSINTALFSFTQPLSNKSTGFQKFMTRETSFPIHPNTCLSSTDHGICINLTHHSFLHDIIRITCTLQVRQPVWEEETIESLKQMMDSGDIAVDAQCRLHILDPGRKPNRWQPGAMC